MFDSFMINHTFVPKKEFNILRNMIEEELMRDKKWIIEE